MEKTTPLYAEHIALGGTVVPFAGWLLPVRYPAGIIAEHNAVRTKCGLFDVSHMGEISFDGTDALANLNYLLTNDFTGMESGRVRYSVMCAEDGGAIDDVLVYKLAEASYLVVVNACNREKDFAWIEAHISGDCKVCDVSDSYAQLALQGPFAGEILGGLTDALPARYYSFLADRVVCGVKCLVSKTGYTGSAGYELYCDPSDAVTLWRGLLEAGKPFGILPCGLGARDTLRLGAAMPLYGHELDANTTPLDAGLGFAVKTSKNFIGRDAMAVPPARERIGLILTDRGVMREHEEIFKDNIHIGVTTSGTFLPDIKASCAMASVTRGSVAVGDTVSVSVRGNALKAKVVALPFTPVVR